MKSRNSNVHFSFTVRNVNECYLILQLLLLVTPAAWRLNWCKHGWKRTGNNTRVSTEWERAKQPVPGQWSHAPGPSVRHWPISQYQDLRSSLTVSLHGNDLQTLGSLPVCPNTRLLLKPPFPLFQNNTAFSFLAAFSTFFMQSLNSCVK